MSWKCVCIVLNNLCLLMMCLFVMVANNAGYRNSYSTEDAPEVAASLFKAAVEEMYHLLQIPFPIKGGVFCVTEALRLN